MEALFRVEFNEDQQMFHLADQHEVAGLHGWETIIPKCSELEFTVFEAFLGRTQKSHNTMKQVKKGYQEFVVFQKALAEQDITFREQNG